MRFMVDRGQFCMMGLKVIGWLDYKGYDHWVYGVKMEQLKRT